MSQHNSSFAHIRQIDNRKSSLSWVTLILIVFLIILFVWFIRGGSFKLYASIFFTLYHFTNQIWVSVILIGVIQNIVFIPLRIIGIALSNNLDDFIDKLAKTSNKSDQYFLFSKKIREGNTAIVFYVFSFFINAIAFFSAGRIFLIDFYSRQIDPKYLYSFVPVPSYPLQGNIFRFPFFNITETIALPWSTIFLIIFGFILVLSLFRLIWRLLKFALWKNKKILSARINYNRLLLKISGFSLTAGIIIIIFLRHIPISFESLVFSFDLSRQNTPMNFITALVTFLTVVLAGYKNNSKASAEAKMANIPSNIIKTVFRDKMKQSFNNAFILGLGAFFITNQIPSAFELSVATFEVMYVISPFTFDLILPKKKPRSVLPDQV